MDESPERVEAPSMPLRGLRGPGEPHPEDNGPLLPLRLVLQPGGSFVELTRSDTLVGRHSDADIRLPLPDVSRRHCRFVFAGQRWQVFDLNSLNGIFVNGDRVKQATIDHGDIIRIGGFVFEAIIGMPVEASNAAAQPIQDNATCANVLRSIADALPRSGAESFPRRKAS
jgi:pSer/pThr/pTyr-binding forkhead associated (FHA) protein